MEAKNNSGKKSAATTKLNKCLMCPKAFRQRAHLNTHLSTHTKEKPYKCLMCAKVFAEKGQLNGHIKSHTKEKHYKCPICLVAFASTSNLKKHTWRKHERVKRSLKIKPSFKCPECNYECSVRKMMVVHSRKHSGETPYSCKSPGCSFKTKYLGSFRRHLVRLHNHERPFECQSDGCSYKTKDLDHLRQHSKVHSNERPFPCTFTGCTYTSKTKGTLNGHINNVHCDKKPFKCSTCDFETKYEFRLRQHEDDHTNIKRFHCPFPNCNYASNYKSVIQPHVDRNHRKKSLCCSVPGCNVKCGSIAVFNAHMKIHVNPILNCPGESCNFSSRKPKDLRKHVARHHEDIQVDSAVVPRRFSLLAEGKSVVPKLIVCRFANCEYQTEFQHQYDRHLKMHDRENKCEFCPLKFGNNHDLKTHIQRHIGEKPYRCSQCPYSTIYSFQLKNHASKSHEIYVTVRKKKLRR